MAQFDIRKWFGDLRGSVTAGRALMTTLLTALVAVTTWIASQVGAVSEAVDRYATIQSAQRTERNTYAEDFRKGDPTKGDFLNDVVYRVRIQVMEPKVGAELLCWLAARADARSPDAGPVDATTPQKILDFMDRNKALFELDDGGPMPWDRREMKAAEYCAPYLPGYAQPQRETTEMAETGEIDVAAPPPAPPAPPLSGEAPRPSVLDSGSSRLFLHVADEGQRVGAAELGRSIQRRHDGIAYQGVERIATYTGESELRYYKLADDELANALAAILTCDGVIPAARLVSGYNDSRLVRPGTLELWIGPGTSACTLAD